MTVEIIGRAIRAPMSRDTDEFFELLRNETCAITTIPPQRWGHARFWHPVPGTPGKSYTFAAGVLDDIYTFDPGAFGLTAREAMYMDPQQRVLLELVLRALEDASLSVSSLQNERVGVYIGASSLDNGNTYLEDPASGSPYFMTGNTLSIIANRISHVFGLSGPSLTIDTACSSSLVAIDQAVRAIDRGEIDTAIVGGISILAHPFSFVGFSQARMLSPEGLCKAYSEDAQGYVRSEGGGVVILRSTQRAVSSNDRSYARIVGSGLNSAGRTNGISLPSRESQAALLRQVYADYNLDPNDLAFIEGHGTGTKVGDPAEVWAIGTELGQRRSSILPIGSVKTNVGHSEPASGMFGLIKSILSLQHDFLPASLHADNLNSDIDFDGLNVSVNRQGRHLERTGRTRLVGINSFGFGGTNAHLVVADPALVQKKVAQIPSYFMISAHTEQALDNLLADYAIRLSATDSLDVLAASGANGDPYRHRYVATSANADSVRHDLTKYLAGGTLSQGVRAEALVPRANLAFAFAGNGSQWAGMALDAYHRDTTFRQRFDDICAAFEPWLEEDIGILLHSEGLNEKLADTRYGQALLFAIQASLSDSLAERKIVPSVVFGHSVGEIAAAYCAGCLNLEDAIAIVTVRSRHQHALRGEGTMAAVALSPERAIALASEHGLEGIVVGAINTESSVTISGPADQIRTYRAIGRKTHVAVHVLDIDYPFHHPIIDRERDAFLRDLPPYTPKSGHIQFVSAVTGQLLDGEKLTPAYWWNNVREVVRFSDACDTALRLGTGLFLEISPRPILASYLNENIRQHGAAASVIATLNRPGREDNPVAYAFSSAIAHGAQVCEDISSMRRSWVRLPGLPFERQDLRPARTSDSTNLFDRQLEGANYSLLGWRIDPNAASWKNHLDANLFPDLAEHVVEGRSILPGSAFIEIAVAAAQQFHGNFDIEVRNLEIVRALELGTTKLKELSTILSPETGQVEIRSRDYLSDDDWVTHAVARVRIPVVTLGHSSVLPSGKGVEKISAAKAYATARLFGLDYGPTFQLLEKATLVSERDIVVGLKPVGPARHPHISYGLNPVSVDAAFHGLVALFDRLTDDTHGAPYIPVRFGSIRTASLGAEIRTASITIQRMSAHTIKARIELSDADGELVAVLDDCRFRRTSFKRPQSLESLAYHYEAMSPLPAPAVRPSLQDLVHPPATEQMSPSALLIDAAIYRACFDLAIEALYPEKSGNLDKFADHPAFRSYLLTCFNILSHFGLAELEEGEWHLAQECDLPVFDALISELLANHPERSAVTVLINDTYRRVLWMLQEMAAPDGGGTDVSAFSLSDATLDHARNHSPLARRRADEVYSTVEAYLSKSLAPELLTIAEFSAASVEGSLRLADLIGRFGAKLVVFATDDNLRRATEMAVAGMPQVIVADSDLVAPQSGIDLVVGSSGFLCADLDRSTALKTAFRFAAEAGAQLMLLEHPSSGLSDFVLGLSDGWFDATVVPELPVGATLSASEMSALVEGLGFGDVEARQLDFADGPLVALTGTGRKIVSTTPLVPIRETLLIAPAGKQLSDGMPRPRIALSATSALDAGRVAASVADMAGSEFDILCIVPTMSDSGEAETLADCCEVLRNLADGIRAAPAHPVRPRLFVILPGGAPLSRADGNVAAQAIWAYCRVLHNEYDELDCVLVDIDLVSLTQDRWFDLLALNRQGETEIQFDDVNGIFRTIRAVAGPLPAYELTTTRFGTANIVQDVPGRIDTIKWQAVEAVRAPAAGEVVIAVSATGLNFRDVMWAMGLLPEEALEDGFAGSTIGMEFSGTVIEVGSAVSKLKPGDAVMGIGSDAFSTHVVVQEGALTVVPEDITLLQAATLPVTFLTAYYALVELARLRSSDTVLIHGAAGGVGLAALQIAKLRGATVIATAGSAEKRHLVTTLGADHVFDSRSLSFVDHVLECTNGKGVDVVINSLFSEAMERSLELVKPFGRFLELGKRDYYADRKIGLRPFRKNISYFGIDADQLLVEAPEVTQRIFGEISELFRQGHLQPLAYRAFRYDELSAAFRLMQSSGHIGKIIVTPPKAGRDAVLKPAMISHALSKGSYLVIGGIGGFGLEAAEWLVRKGATHIALATRSGIPDRATTVAVERWRKDGVTASVHACDVTNEDAVITLLDMVRAHAPLKGVVHAAMVLDDTLICNSDRSRDLKVLQPKVTGAGLLDRLTQSDSLDLFLMFSSATTFVGNPGQGNYVAANGYLEGLARNRRRRGKVALAVGFGAISDAGYLARNIDVGDKLSRRIGEAALTARQALRFVDHYMAVDTGSVEAAVVMIAEIDWRSASMLRTVQGKVFSALGASDVTNTGDLEQIDIAHLVAGKKAEQADALLLALIAAELSAILKISEQNITPEKLLRDLGLDSLMAMELGTSFQQKTGVDLPLSGMTDTTTVGQIVAKLREKLVRSEDDIEMQGDEILQTLAAQHATAEMEDVGA